MWLDRTYQVSCIPSLSLSTSDSFCVRIVYLKAHDGKLLFWIANMAWPSERDSFMCVKCLINFFLSFFFPFLACWEKGQARLFFFILFLRFWFSRWALLLKMKEEKNKQNGWEKETKPGTKQGIEKESDAEWKIYKTRAQQQQQQSNLVVSSFARCSLKLMILLFQNLWTFMHSFQLTVNPFLPTFFPPSFPIVQHQQQQNEKEKMNCLTLHFIHTIRIPLKRNHSSDRLRIFNYNIFFSLCFCRFVVIHRSALSLFFSFYVIKIDLCDVIY